MSRGIPALLALCLLAGCAAAPETASSETPPVSPVYTDWSRLTPYEQPEPLYTPFAPFQGETLTPREDYGVLLPYLGASILVSDYIVDALPLYGLVTSGGQIVTEPVYADIYTPTDAGQGSAQPFLILLKGDPAAGAGNGRETEAGEFLLTVAAPDGRWVRDFGIANASPAADGYLAVTETDDSITVIQSDGETAAYFPRSALTPYLGEDFRLEWESCGVNWIQGVGAVYQASRVEQDPDYRYTCYLDIRDGSVSVHPPEDFSEEWEGGGYQERNVEGYGFLDPLMDPVTGAIYYCGCPVESTDYRTVDILDQDGRKLLTVHTGDFLYTPILRAGLCSSVEEGAFCYYDLSGGCVFRFPLRTNAD